MTKTAADENSPAPSGRSHVVWLLCAFLALFLGTWLLSAWLVRHAMSGGPRLTSYQKEFVLAVSDFPSMVRAALVEVQTIVGDRPVALLMDRRGVETRNWTRHFPEPEDPGFLLLSGVDANGDHAMVRLLRIADGKELARWDPDWSAIYEKISDKKLAPKGSVHSALPMHPLLLDDGDVVFNTNNALVRLGTCTGKPVWVVDEIMHHSNELAPDGSIWTPTVTFDGLPENPWLQERIRDDGLARVSVDGRVLERHSLVRALRDNGLTHLLMGTTGGVILEDPIHLNEIKAAPSDTKYWKKGDLLLSARHLSTVLLYRPSTRQVVWYQMGPWMNQHSPDFIDDHRISVFDNNVYAGAPDQYSFVARTDINRVFVYDFETAQVSQPFAALLDKTRPRTITAGRARILPDGGLFLEETQAGRHLRFTKDRLLWSRVNDYDQTRIGQVAWSRYLTEEQVGPALKALAGRKCPAK